VTWSRDKVSLGDRNRTVRNRFFFLLKARTDHFFFERLVNWCHERFFLAKHFYAVLEFFSLLSNLADFFFPLLLESFDLSIKRSFEFGGFCEFIANLVAF